MSLLILLAQCVCMFIASFAVGSLPLMFKSSAQGQCLGYIERAEWRLTTTRRQATESDIYPRHGFAGRSSFDHHHSRVRASTALSLMPYLILVNRGVSTVYEALGESDEEHHDESTTRAIGLALLSGFALMLLCVHYCATSFGRADETIGSSH